MGNSYLREDVYEDKWAIMDGRGDVIGEVVYEDYDSAKRMFDFLITQTTFYSKADYKLVSVRVVVTMKTEVFEND